MEQKIVECPGCKWVGVREGSYLAEKCPRCNGQLTYQLNPVGWIERLKTELEVANSRIRDLEAEKGRIVINRDNEVKTLNTRIERLNHANSRLIEKGQ